MSPEMSLSFANVTTAFKPIQAESLMMPLYRVVVPGAEHTDFAKIVSDWTISAASKGLMLPKTPEQMLDLFGEGRSVIMLDDRGNPVSHAAATFMYSDGKVIEVGAVYTAEEKRGMGLSKQTVGALLRHLNERNPDADTIFALANRNSEPVFMSLGGTKMRTTELPEEVWLACKDCPNRPPEGSREEHVCCDTPINLTNFTKGKISPGNCLD